MNRPPTRATASSGPNNQGAAPGKNVKPVHEIRVGFTKARIWANATANGLMHNVSLCRFYKSGDEWRFSDSFGRDDLLNLAKAVDLAHTWICEHPVRGANRQESDDPADF